MQEMLFRRTCKLVELETARRNAEKAKPVKKAAVSLVPMHNKNTLLDQMYVLPSDQQVSVTFF